MGAKRNHQRDYGPGVGSERWSGRRRHCDRHAPAKPGSDGRLSTDESGRFGFPQLRPGPYSVRVQAPGFDEQVNESVSAGLGRDAHREFHAEVRRRAGRTSPSASEAPLINVENPNTTTTLSGRAIQDLPNPGGDLTYPAQFAPGALINTAGSSNDFVGGQNGYGNVQFNGLPALSNAYIVDGLETNDPLTNLNSGLSTNLVLGLNSIEEVTVNTTSYAVDQGRYGASQINYVTKSGTNTLHGNLYELWNGSRLNAADFFTNATPGGHKPRSTVNHFGGSLGGPVVHDKLFFFGDFEQMRIALPIVNAVTLPTAAFQSYVLQQLPKGGVDPVSGIELPRRAGAGAVLPEHVLAVSEHGRNSASRAGLPVERRWQPGGGRSAEWKRLREPADNFAVERRPRTGGHGPDRSQHRRGQHGLVPPPVRHGTAGGLHGPDQSAVQLRSHRSRYIRSQPDTRTSSARTC